ncbi:MULTISPECIES: TetR/AcrR family transcriptional regulator [unclassified Streptomyces]|uniref:TetR/AcrR family transcriptional regulator n=1 Tax=unclassified Streptomyces TaxID=2593676 RepID=UPI00382E29A1
MPASAKPSEAPRKPSKTSPPKTSGKPARVTKRRAETRAQLFAAASEVFAEKGLGRASIDDVCARAGYTRGAFYSNFKTLDELILALYAVRGAELIRTIEAAAAAAVTELTTAAGPDTDQPPGMSRLVEAVTRVVATLAIDRDAHLLHLEFTAHAIRHPEAAEAFTAHRRTQREALIPVVRAALRGLGHEATDERLEQTVRAMLAVRDGMTSQEVLEPDNGELPRLHEKLMAATIEMLEQ